MKRLTFVVLCALLTLPVHASTQGNTESSGIDPLLGVWQLNLAKSRYVPGPPPKSQTRSYEKHRFGISATVKTVQADGRSTTVQTVYDFDNEEHPVTGSEEIDTIVMKRITPYLHEATLSHAGTQIGTFRREISKDGKQMTVTTKRQSPDADNVEVYDKVEQ